MKSHPLRVRGLKPLSPFGKTRSNLSHPLRVRGLKLYLCRSKHLRTGRILYGCVDWNPEYVGATGGKRMSHPLRVRGLKPRGSDGNPGEDGSHPLRVRGLKHDIQAQIWSDKTSRILYGCVDWNRLNLWIKYRLSIVASFTGAWIETSPWPKAPRSNGSHPLRVRGLKL